MSTRTTRTTPAIPRGSRLGERLRQLRVSAGLTQSELAGDRFSKEYVSQIERGKTQPTGETVKWLASRLGVDPSFLATGVSSDERARAEAILTRAETLSERRDYDDAIDAFSDALAAVVATGAVDLQVRVLSGEAWARAHRGEVRPAIDLLEQSRGLVEGSSFTDLDRAEVIFRLGVARYLISSISTAIALFGEALSLVDHSPLPSDLLRANVLTWRSRCYRRQRDYEAARDDVTRALELAESMGDARALGEVYFQASLIAERDGHWVLARTYAERAKAQYEALTDRVTVGKLLNNLGGLEFLLGKPEEAIARLNESLTIALEHGPDTDTATTFSSLAQVHLRTGNLEKAEEFAREALKILGTREDQWTRSATRASCSGARCWSRTDSTRPKPRSPRPRTHLPNSHPAHTEPQPGWRRAISPDAAGTTAAQPLSTEPQPRLSKTSGSKPREEVKTVATRLALLISRRRSLLTIVSVGAALIGAKYGQMSALAGFHDGS